MAHDRVSGATILLTHEFPSLMLGERRAGVTATLQALIGRGLIRSARGSITVLDRKGLETSAGTSTACRKPNIVACWPDIRAFALG
jgi:hypothetical protein